MGLDLFFPPELINSKKVNYPGSDSSPHMRHSGLIRVYMKSLTVCVCVIQSRQLRKLIQQTFQQYATLREEDCMVKFFETLRDFVSYDEEVFPCELVVSIITKYI